MILFLFRFIATMKKNIVTKVQTLSLSDIGKWIDCYRFTHPDCISVSVKVWF